MFRRAAWRGLSSYSGLVETHHPLSHPGSDGAGVRVQRNFTLDVQSGSSLKFGFGFNAPHGSQTWIVRET
jgi:hypothetical protein